eukprot:960002-Pyramimonas_sp.AAC.1
MGGVLSEDSWLAMRCMRLMGSGYRVKSLLTCARRSAFARPRSRDATSINGGPEANTKHRKETVHRNMASL